MRIPASFPWEGIGPARDLLELRGEGSGPSLDLFRARRECLLLGPEVGGLLLLLRKLGREFADAGLETREFLVQGTDVLIETRERHAAFVEVRLELRRLGAALARDLLLGRVDRLREGRPLILELLRLAPKGLEVGLDLLQLRFTADDLLAGELVAGPGEARFRVALLLLELLATGSPAVAGIPGRRGGS